MTGKCPSNVPQDDPQGVAQGKNVSEDVGSSNRTSTGQVQPHKLTPQVHPTSTRQVPDKLIPDNISVRKVIEAVGNNQLSVKEMMQSLSLADRENFLNNYLNPAIKDGFVRLLYPDSPRHPRQKYLLTVNGLAAFQELQH